MSGADPINVLVVDDDEAIRLALVDALSDSGFTVLQAANGVVAVEILRASPVPLVVLLDHVMPEMTGIAVVEMVAHDPQVRDRHAYLLLTASARVGEIQQHLAQLPVRTVPAIRKPFDLDTLITGIQEAAADLLSRRNSDV